MDRVVNFNFVPHPSISDEVVFGTKDSCPIDQSPVQSFNIDPDTGNPMSTIDVILKAQGLEQRKALEMLTEYKSSFLPDNISNEQALKYAVPRLCQMPSELAEWQESITQKELEIAEQKANEDRLRKLFDEPKKDDKVEPKES